MGILTRFAGWLESRWHPLPPPITTSWLLSSGLSDTGQNITPDTAMAAAAVFACVDVISRSLATIPIRIRERDSQEEVTDHPLIPLLNDSPNSEMTSASFRESSMVNTLLWGNGFSYVERDGLAPVALWPLRAGSTSPQRYPGGPLYYSSVTGSGSYTLTPDQMLHVPDISYDGIVGLSRTRYAANPIGLALAMESYAAKFFANGGNSGGLLKLPAGMKDEAVNAYVKSWQQHNAGNDNAFKVALLTDGITFERLQNNSREAQLIDGRKFEVLEMCRLFRVPPHKVASMDGATFSNIEQQNIEFVTDCLGGWAVKLEQEYSRKLLSETEKKTLAIKFDFSALLRGDTTSRFASYNTALQSGWMTRNEVRAKEGLPPIDGGDQPLQPLNMGNSGGNSADKPAGDPVPPGQPGKPKDSEAEEAEEEGDRSLSFTWE